MRYKIFNHQRKGDLYQSALDAKARRVEKPPFDFVFTDQAIYGRVGVLKNLHARMYFLYPHSGRPSLSGDMVPIWDRIDAEFVAAEGHRQVLRAYGHDRHIHVVGWHLCPIREFQESKDIRNVLFAPIHPRCAEVDKELNNRVFLSLQALDVHVTVRHIGPLKESGIERKEYPNVTYFEGRLNPTYDQIDSADVVVGHQTFGYLGVARGKPTVMFGEDMVPHLVPNGKELVYPKTWSKYKHLLRYPLDFDDDLPANVLQKAIKRNGNIEEWKDRMIGKPFDQNLFLERLGKHL